MVIEVADGEPKEIRLMPADMIEMDAKGRGIERGDAMFRQSSSTREPASLPPVSTYKIFHSDLDRIESP
ncbi:MAG: hypothetical protein ABFC89_13525 [Methanospirillum sp.]